MSLVKIFICFTLIICIQYTVQRKSHHTRTNVETSSETRASPAKMEVNLDHANTLEAREIKARDEDNVIGSPLINMNEEDRTEDTLETLEDVQDDEDDNRDDIMVNDGAADLTLAAMENNYSRMCGHPQYTFALEIPAKDLLAAWLHKEYKDHGAKKVDGVLLSSIKGDHQDHLAELFGADKDPEEIVRDLSIKLCRPKLEELVLTKIETHDWDSYDYHPSEYELEREFSKHADGQIKKGEATKSAKETFNNPVDEYRFELAQIKIKLENIQNSSIAANEIAHLQAERTEFEKKIALATELHSEGKTELHITHDALTEAATGLNNAIFEDTNQDKKLKEAAKKKQAKQDGQGEEEPVTVDKLDADQEYKYGHLLADLIIKPSRSRVFCCYNVSLTQYGTNTYPTSS